MTDKSQKIYSTDYRIPKLILNGLITISYKDRLFQLVKGQLYHYIRNTPIIFHILQQEGIYWFGYTKQNYLKLPTQIFPQFYSQSIFIYLINVKLTSTLQCNYKIIEIESINYVTRSLGKKYMIIKMPKSITVQLHFSDSISQSIQSKLLSLQKKIMNQNLSKFLSNNHQIQTLSIQNDLNQIEKPKIMINNIKQDQQTSQKLMNCTEYYENVNQNRQNCKWCNYLNQQIRRKFLQNQKLQQKVKLIEDQNIKNNKINKLILQQQANKFNKSNKTNQETISSLNSKIAAMEKNKKQKYINTNMELLHIFQGTVLNKQCSQEKLFIKKSIEQYVGKHIQFTRMVYHYDSLNPTNFHKYIDNIHNICTVVRTVCPTSQQKQYKKHLLAGFSVDPLNINKVTGDKGILMSITNHQIYKCLPNKRSMTYDQFFLIYGNSELRIRMGEKKVFSNFGINAAHYANPNKDSVTVYMGQNQERQVDLISYDIFQVQFKQ